MKSHRTKVAGAAVLLAVTGAGAGVAIADTGALSPSAESEAIVNDVAEELDVSASEVREALRSALAERVDAAVAAGRLTEEQGEALKERIRAGELPLAGGLLVGRGGFGHLGGLDAAASYLEMSEAELRAAEAGGQTLAEIAGDRGKSEDGLVDAMVEAATERLNETVDAGRLTDAQRQTIRAELEERIADLVDGDIERPAHARFAGPPPSLGPPSG